VPDAPRGHELVEHTADVGLRVWGQSLEDVFAQAAIGLVAVMGRADGPSVSETVKLDAPDLGALFVDWLSEVLFLFEARQVAPTDVRVRIDREACGLSATIDGVKAASFVQEGPAVKAVTYHGLEISDHEAVVYLDV
jgi:SHS2 domain-containing protein